MKRLLTATLVAAATAVPAQASDQCHTAKCKHRVIRKHKRKVVKPLNPKLERMAQCESGGRWHINTGNGFYGGLQFDLQTWNAVGGFGFPNQNTELEQKYRAVKLIRIRGFQPWPECGSDKVVQSKGK